MKLCSKIFFTSSSYLFSRTLLTLLHINNLSMEFSLSNILHTPIPSDSASYQFPNSSVFFHIHSLPIPIHTLFFDVEGYLSFVPFFVRILWNSLPLQNMKDNFNQLSFLPISQSWLPFVIIQCHFFVYVILIELLLIFTGAIFTSCTALSPLMTQIMEKLMP